MLDLLVRMTRITLYLCFGAVSKTLEETVIHNLPMGSETRSVFRVLDFLVLLAFCVDVVKLLFESATPNRRHARTRGRIGAATPRGLVGQANLRQILDQVKSRLRKLAGSDDDDTPRA
jgi:hypothetical protein